MLCPFCGCEMMRGSILVPGRRIAWLPDGVSVYVGGQLTKRFLRRNRGYIVGTASDWVFASSTAYVCPDCKKVVLQAQDP